MAEREDIAYLSDMGDVARVPDGATPGNFAAFGAGGVLQDSGKSPSDIAALRHDLDSTEERTRDALRSEYAIAAYSAAEWEPDTPYEVGDFCSHGGDGYRCTEEHVSGEEFDQGKWDMVLSSAGKQAIQDMLDGYSREGDASLQDLAPEYNPGRPYRVDELTIKDGRLQRCTSPGSYGAIATFSNSTVEAAIQALKAKLAPEFDSTKIYIPGRDIVMHNGILYRCTVPHSGGWVSGHFSETTIAEAVAAIVGMLMPSNLYVKDEGTGLFHKVTIETEEGISVISVDQDGVAQGGAS